MTQRKKQVYLMLMALGGVALLVDRFFLGGAGIPTLPAASLAAGADSAVGLAPNASATPVAAPRPVAQVALAKPPIPVAPACVSIPELPFPRRLPAWDASAPIRDLFAPPGARDVIDGVDGQTHNGVGRGGPATDASPMGRKAFATQHHLKALLLGERLGIAVVDDRWMQLGDLLAGCELVELNAESAQFQCHDGSVSLTLEDSK